MKINREDMVQSALNVQRWCETHSAHPVCDCPLFKKDSDVKCFIAPMIPKTWHLEEKLRTKGNSYD